VTRLTEAFDRARRTTSDSFQPEAESVPASNDAVPDPVVSDAAPFPSTWRFDNDDIQMSVETPSLPVDALDSVEAFAPVDAFAADSRDEPTPQVGDDERFEYPFTKVPGIGAKLVVGESPNHTLVEQFRHLAASLHHAQLRTGIKTVMIASAVEAEGKTTTAANLALTFSHSHRRRVLLVDADLRRPSIHMLFQLSNREGLNDALKVVTPNTPLPLHKISPTLSVLTAGQPTADPMSALVSDMMREFMREAAENYDWVVLDTPPVALLSDANLLAAMIDAAIIVVSASTTPYPLVRRAVEAIGPAKVVGTVLNRVKRPGLASRYRYGYGYAYSYRYSPRESKSAKRKGWVFPFSRKG